MNEESNYMNNRTNSIYFYSYDINDADDVKSIIYSYTADN